MMSVILVQKQENSKEFKTTQAGYDLHMHFKLSHQCSNHKSSLVEVNQAILAWSIIWFLL